MNCDTFTRTFADGDAAIPPLFREALAEAGMLAIDDWWRQLDTDARADALRLWDDCNRDASALAVRVEGRFAGDEEQPEEKDEFWHSDFYHYLVNHELYFVPARKFHICTRHPVAAAAVKEGRIPADFGCPFASADCPMRTLLAWAPGKSVRLSVALVKARDAVPPSSHAVTACERNG